MDIFLLNRGFFYFKVSQIPSTQREYSWNLFGQREFMKADTVYQAHSSK